MAVFGDSLGFETVGRRGCREHFPDTKVTGPFSASRAFLLMAIFFAKNEVPWSERPEH